MTSEVIIDVQPKEISIALLEDKNLVEYQSEKREEESYSVGNIYLGKVRKLMPGLNACFIDVGSERDAFSLNTALTRNTLNRYKATRRNFIPSRKLRVCPTFPRKAASPC